MFGYVTIYKGEMKIKDFEMYKSVYCGLCKQLGKDYSFLTRFLLNYDCTFFSVFSMAVSDACPDVKKGRCRFNPMKSCNYCADTKGTQSKAAALLVLMAYFKLLDNIHDSGVIKKVLCTLICPFMSSWKRKARKRFPEYYDACLRMYEDQQKAEKSGAGIDESAEPTAVLLKFVFSAEAPDERVKPAFEQFGYHLGKWIYLMDAACDIDEDIKHKSFNPIYNKTGKSKAESAEFSLELLSHSVYLLTSAYRLIDKNKFEAILDNIVLLGLTKKQKDLLESGKEKINE